MALSDACFEFGQEILAAKSDLDRGAAVTRLCDAISEYSDPAYSYGPELLQRLRDSSDGFGRHIAESDERLKQLINRAESVRLFLDDETALIATNLQIGNA